MIASLIPMVLEMDLLAVSGCENNNFVFFDSVSHSYVSGCENNSFVFFDSVSHSYVSGCENNSFVFFDSVSHSYEYH